jgi:hypothetical protein
MRRAVLARMRRATLVPIHAVGIGTGITRSG